MDTKQLLIAMATAMVTLVGAYFTFAGTLRTAEPAQYRVLYDRIGVLENLRIADADDREQLIRELAAMELRIAAAASTSPREVVDSLLGSITDYPAWCKRYDADRDVFIMWALNDAYSNFYGVTKSLYLGNTDFYVWGPDIGSVFDANDRLALERKDFYRVVESVVPDGATEPKNFLFWKFYVPLYDATELVCGVQIDVIEQPEVRGEL